MAGDIEAKIKGIEDELSENQKIIDTIKGSIQELSDDKGGHVNLHDTLNKAGSSKAVNVSHTGFKVERY